MLMQQPSKNAFLSHISLCVSVFVSRCAVLYLQLWSACWDLPTALSYQGSPCCRVPSASHQLDGNTRLKTWVAGGGIACCGSHRRILLILSVSVVFTLNFSAFSSRLTVRDTIKLLCITAQPKVTAMLKYYMLFLYTIYINSHCSSKISNCLVILMFVIYYLLGKKVLVFCCHQQLFSLVFFQVSLRAQDLVKVSSTTSYCGMECDSAVHTARSGFAGVHHLSPAAGKRFNQCCLPSVLLQTRV